jgi:hypothetical protein
MTDLKNVSAGTVALESPQADSLTVTGDLTVDTTTLKVDSTNNRVGIGTASPSEVLEVNGNIKFGDGHFIGDGGGDNLEIVSSSGENIIYKAAGGIHAFYDSGSNERMRIDSSGNVGIGKTPEAWASGFTALQVGGLMSIYSQDGETASNAFQIQQNAYYDGSWKYMINDETSRYSQIDGTHRWYSAGAGAANTAISWSEHMRVTSGGTLCVDTTGTYLSGSDRIVCAGVLAVNSPTYAAGFNVANDGNNIFIMQGGSTEGIISVSGSTVTYGGFTGSHWGRLDDNSKPEILRGTVLETTGNMIDWYRAEFTVTRQETDENGVVSDVTETKSHEIAKPDGVNVGDTFDYVLADDNEWDITAGTYTATLLQEGDVKHVHTKVSDTSESKAVYGVFGHWDYDCADNVNDMQVASLGTYIVRVNPSETVAIGDLLDSNGDGTAKVQSDDIVRARTVGKVISTVKQETYSDGSYTVPCAIYCG